MKGGLQNLMKQAQKMQKQMQKMQDELENIEVEASVGGGMVKAKVNGQKKLLSVTIEPDVIESDDFEIDMLQDLIVAAVNEAVRQAEEQHKDKMEGIVPNGLMNQFGGMF